MKNRNRKKSQLFIWVGLIVMILMSGLQGRAQVSVIPQPSKVELRSGNDSFVLSPQTFVIVKQASLKPSAGFLNSYLKQQYGITLPSKQKNQPTIVLQLDKTAAWVQGAYMLEVEPTTITIRAGEESGIFYGVQTLIQLLPANNSIPKSQLQIPLLTIRDTPRFQYRGMMLDCCRHFFPVSFVKKYIDYLALHKLNYFHWHLTDDQGWRIEIKKFPELTRKGAWREGTITGHYPGTGNDNQPYGGYYTQEEIKEVVAYAAKRYITVIPEIEMPGHSSAAIAAYPWLSCFPQKPTNLKKSPVSTTVNPSIKKVAQTWGVFEDVYCAGKDSTFLFLQGVLDEVLLLFPSKYIHIGGDESPKTHWKECPLCQQRIKTEGLKNEEELQSYFIHRMDDYLTSKGRILIGWDEILEGGLSPNAVVMSWRGEKGAVEAARQHHEVIMTPNSHLYFDQYQAKASEEPLAIGGYNPLSKVYGYDPVPAELDSVEARYIKGMQANLWAEYIPSPDHAEYMVLPRMAALAETAWSAPSNKDWESFRRRMEQQFLRYEALGAHYSRAAFDVQISVLIETIQTKATVSLTTESYGTEVRYTIDGTKPTAKSTLYKQPFVMRKSCVIKTASFKEGKQAGGTAVQEIILVTRE